jgi:hypothetical protein
MRLALLVAVVGCAPTARHEYQPPAQEPYEVQYRQLNRAWHNVGHDVALKTEIKDAFLEAAKAEHLAGNTWSLFDQNQDRGWPEGDLDKVIAVFEDVPDGHFAASLQHIEAARFKLLHTHDEVANAAFGRMLHELGYVRALLYGAPPPAIKWDVPAVLAHIDAAADTALRLAHNQRSYEMDPAGFAKTPYLIRLQMAHDVLDRAAKDLEADASPKRGEVVSRVRAVLAEVDAARGPIAKR